MIASAQSYRNDASKKYSAMPRSKKKIKEKIYKDNVVKLNLSGLIIKSVGLQYERKTSRKTSFALGVIYRPKSSWFLSKFFDTTTLSTGYSQETKSMLASSKYRSFMVTPEFKYYLGRQAPHGLYLSAFLRYKSDRTDFNYHYYEDINPNQQIGLASLKETMIGGGILFGYQLVTSKRLTIDFWFVGPWIGNRHVNLSSKVNTANISELQQKFIAQDMKPLFGKEHEIYWDKTGIATTFNYFDFSARFVGINIGYSF